MKHITYYVRLAMFVCAIASFKLSAQNCAASFSYNIMANGVVTFSSTSVPQNSLTGYYWTFGNSTTYTVTGNPFATTTYSANGTYVVTLFILSSVPNCSAAVSQTLTITNANPNGCFLNANFNFSQGSNGLVNFNNTSSGTVPGTTYSWNFGDGSPVSSATSPSHTYLNNGTYQVMLFANNNFTNNACFDSVILNVVVNSICNISPSFTYTQGSNGLVNFQSTSSGTIPATQYFWNFGDGSNGTGINTSHTYSNGTYMATLTVANNSLSCFSSTTQTLTVTSNTCFVNASFTETVGANGLVTFNSTSTGTNANTTYTWNFGNGFGSNQLNPSQVYINGGIHYVTLTAMNNPGCSSVLTRSVNISTVPCTANANFTMVPAGPPQFWNAIPAYPYNVGAASWSWGDGQTSNSLYASHGYSVTGSYNICLTVTASCGATATACNSYSIYRSASNIIYVNVTAPPVQMNAGTSTALNEVSQEMVYGIFPNPSSNKFTVSISGSTKGMISISMRNILGAEVYTTSLRNDGATLNHEIDAGQNAPGIYFISVEADRRTYTQKVILSR